MQAQKSVYSLYTLKSWVIYEIGGEGPGTLLY